MQEATLASRRVRFGVFEANLQTGELSKQGRRLRLQEQPFQLLALLLERPGALVTREQLRSRLWPQTTVDFDHGVNKAISKLRDALGDSASNPRFVDALALDVIASTEQACRGAPANGLCRSGGAVHEFANHGFVSQMMGTGCPVSCATRR